MLHDFAAPPLGQHEPTPGRMQHFTAALLRHEGALVDSIAPEGFDVLAPPSVQRALRIGELSRLGFGAKLPPGGQRVGLEDDWLERFAELLGPRGRWTRRILTASAAAPGDPQRLLERELLLDNATFRLLDISPAWTRYLVLDFRASAVSEDKRDFMLRLGINLATGTLPDSVLSALSPLLDAPPQDDEPPTKDALPLTWERARLLDLVERGLRPRLATALDPFEKGLRRRLGRDQDRLHRYHSDLHQEAMRRIQVLAEDDPKRTREEQRVEAIAREYSAKIDDLARQYATRVTVAWVQTVELVMPVHRLSVQIRRRKSERMLLLDYNPLARKLETPTCAATASAERPRLVCDDALHLVVPAGLAPCPQCNRAFCRACHQHCPKCDADG